jgi:hypothetical protein
MNALHRDRMTQINYNQIFNLCDIKITLLDQAIQDSHKITLKYKVKKYHIMM